jgi:hypothetical protein
MHILYIPTSKLGVRIVTLYSWTGCVLLCLEVSVVNAT